MKRALLYIESELSNVMLAGGLQANLQGFQFLKEAVIEVLKHPELMQQLTTKLYPSIGQNHHVNPAVVERSMRHTIDVAYRSQALYGLNDLLQAPFFINNDKPCNGVMIALLAEIVRKELFNFAATTNEHDIQKAQLANDIQDFLETYYGDEIAS